MGKTLIASCIADNYVPLLLDMLASLGRRIDDYDIGIVEFGVPDGGGLSEESKRKIRALKPDCRFAASRWFIDIPKKYKNLANKVYCNKVFLPELFPGYDAYVYVDADIWFPDSSTVDEYAVAADECGISVCYTFYPLSSRYLRTIFKRRRPWRPFPRVKVRHPIIRKFELFFGGEEATKMKGSLAINGGLFYIRADHPIWQLWQSTMANLNFNKVLRREVLCDQTCLQYALFKNNIEFGLMTNHYNWKLLWYDSPQELPMWDKKHSRLVDYIYPHAPIKALHFRSEYMDKEFFLKTTDGDTLKTKLTFSAIASLKSKAHG